MATRRMRIKATINVPRGGIKSEPPENTINQLPVALPEPRAPVSPSPVSVLSPRISSDHVSITHTAAGQEEPLDVPLSPGGGVLTRVATPPVSTLDRIPSSPKSSSSGGWSSLQRPSPSKSPASLPPSGSILRRSPSPALSRLTNSPGPPIHSPSSPVKSPVPNYAPLHSPSPVKFISRTPVMVMPTSTVSLSGNIQRPILPAEPMYPTSISPSPLAGIETNIKSPVNYLFRPPPSPSPSHQDFLSVKSPSTPCSSGLPISRPSPAQSPVYGISRPPSTSSANFLFHHLNSNSNSADSHEVAALMGGNSANVLSSSACGLSLYPPSPEKRPHSSVSNRGSENLYPGGGQGAFSSVSSNVNPSPSFAKTMFENPEGLKKRSDEIRKKEGAQPNPTKFATARKEFYDKLQSGQAPERSKLTMLHFTFYNPPNPDGSDKLPIVKRKSRSRASSICSDVSSIAKLEQGGKNDENTAGKANSAPSSIAGSRRTTASSVGSAGSCAASDAGQSEAGSVASNASSGGSMPGPRVKVGPDGQLIIDEKSLVVETTESQRARQQIEDMEVVSGAEYAVGSSGFYRYKKNYRRGQDWTERETIRFYRALNQCGTDFSMMLSLFPHRSRAELKSKFKREDRRNPDMISKALASCIFDPDEGISSDEELSEINGKGTEKDRLLNEEKEVEEVICSTEDPQQEGGLKKKKSKTDKKKKAIQFSTVQMQEFKALSSNTTGIGTGKGRKWNTPVEGPEGGRLTGKIGFTGSNTTCLPFQPPPINNEITGVSAEKAKKKYSRKKKQSLVDVPLGVSDSTGATITAGTTPGTVSIIIASGVISTPRTSGITDIKTEKPDAASKLPVSFESHKSPEIDPVAGAASKRRNRLPKTKPNLKRVDGQGEDSKEGKVETVAAGNSSQSNKQGPGGGVCEDLFRFDESDPLGLKVIPAALPVAEEMDLVGNEEGSESLVIVDLDELNSIKKETEKDYNVSSLSSSSRQPSKIKVIPKKRKNIKSADDGTPPVITRVAVDPYGKSVMTAASTSGSPSTTSNKGMDGASSSPCTNLSQPPCKMVKVLPYRVPGPGGAPSSTHLTSMADELEIEIELSTPSSES